MDTWRHVSESDVKAWRKKVKQDLATRKGVKLEYNTAHTRGLERAHQNPDGSATITGNRAMGIRQHRDTAQIVAEEMRNWVTESRETFMARVRHLKSIGNFSHLTDEQAAERLWDLCLELGQKDAQRVYARDGYDHLFHKAVI